MKKVAMFLVLVMGIVGVAQAQCPANKLVEKMYLVKIAEEAELDAYDMAELLAGYAEYRGMMDELEADLAEAKAAAANGESNALDDLMEINEEIFFAKQEAISEVATLIGEETAAQLYMVVFSPCKAKKAMLDCLNPKPVCAAPAVCAVPAMTPEEEVMATVKEIVAAVLAGDIDGLLAHVSDDFYHPEVGDIDSVNDYIEMGKEAGYLDDVPGLIEEHGGEIFLDDAEVEFDDEEAIVYPIDAMAYEGSVSVELVLVKEDDGKWRVIGGDVDGI